MTGLRFLSFLTATILAFPAFAIIGSVEFTTAEKREHAKLADKIAEYAGQCLHDHWNDHVEFYNSHVAKGKHLSKYFGNRRWIKGERNGVRKDIKGNPVATLFAIRPELRKMGFDPDLENEMRAMSCVDLSRVCLGAAFDEYGQGEYWNRIDEFSEENDRIGSVILVGLQSLGWKIVYWNPDPSRNAEFDAFDTKAIAERKVGKAIKGDHGYIYSTIKSRNLYLRDSTKYEYIVDDKTTLVGFKTNPPEAFKKIPFSVGIANQGYHVFLTTFGEVIEAHSARRLDALDNMEFNPFNPLAGQAPKDTTWEHYRSGIIAVPPGYL